MPDALPHEHQHCGRLLQTGQHQRGHVPLQHPFAHPRVYLDAGVVFLLVVAKNVVAVDVPLRIPEHGPQRAFRVLRDQRIDHAAQHLFLRLRNGRLSRGKARPFGMALRAHREKLFLGRGRRRHKKKCRGQERDASVRTH